MRVLVTRPEPGASRTAARLEAAGHEAVILPLTETIGVPVKGAALPSCDLIAVTSVNALRFTPRALLPTLTAKPLFAVGAQTAEAAREAGFDEVIEGPSDAVALAALIRERAKPSAQILYLCGKVRHPAFEADVKAAGFPVVPVETYDVARVDYSDTAVLDAIGGSPVDAVLLYSAVAASAYRDLAARTALASALAAPRIACLSQRIATALGGLADGTVRVAEEPNEAALLALLMA